MKTCLTFLIIKVNEKSILTPHQQTTTTATTTTTGINGSSSTSNSPKSNEIEEIGHLKQTPKQTLTAIASTKQNNKRQRLHNNQQQQKQRQPKQKHNQLASPPQDQVSSTQDQVGLTQDDHDCQTSPLMLITTQVDDDNQIETMHDGDKQLQDSPPLKHYENRRNSPAQLQSSPSLNYASTTTATTTTTSTSPSQTETNDGVTISSNISSKSTSSSSTSSSSNSNFSNGDSNGKRKSNGNHQNGNGQITTATRKRKKIRNNSDHDTSSTASWSSSYTSPPAPISNSSISSTSSPGSSSSSSSSSSSCSSSLPPSPSPSPLSSPDIVNELRGPRLKLSEEMIRKIKKRPILFDDYYMEHSFASTPTTSSGCSPGQHSNTTQNSDQSRSGLNTNTAVIHTFQAPPKFVNSLKPCNLPTKPQQPSPTITSPAQTKEMLKCAICGIKERPPKISKIYGQNSCSLCTKFFVTFLKRPQQMFCSQDGDCLMTFDSRCQACWIKICLQKFDIEEEHRKIGQKYSPKLLSSPNVSLITIDTSLSR